MCQRGLVFNKAVIDAEHDRHGLGSKATGAILFFTEFYIT